MSRRCTKSLKVTDHRSGELVSLDFARHQLYVLGVNGALRRVRHRDQLPVDPTGSGLLVWSIPSCTTLTSDLAEKAAALLAEESPLRLVSLVPGATAGLTFQARVSAPVPGGFLTTTSLASLLGEGGVGFSRDEKSELFALLTTDRLSETMYESLEARSARLVSLVQRVTTSDPEWLVAFATRLRQEHKSRSASLALAVEAVLAGHPKSREILAATLQRPDEPGQALRYFYDSRGRSPIPNALKHGLAEAATRLYTERAVVNFDFERNRGTRTRGITTPRPVRFADVVALTHPKPTSEAQSALFAYLRNPAALDAEILPTLANAKRLAAMGPDERTTELRHTAELAREVLSSGYANRRPVDTPLTALGFTQLSNWRADSPAALALRPRLHELRAQEEADRQELYAAYAEFFQLHPTKTKFKYLHLAEHERDDQRLLARLVASGNAAEAAALREVVSAREPKLKAALSALDEATAALQRIHAARAKHGQSLFEVEELREAIQEANQQDPEFWQVAVTTMGYKETLSNLAHLVKADPEVAAFASARLADPRAIARADVQLPDIMTAARAVADQYDTATHNYWSRRAYSSDDATLTPPPMLHQPELTLVRDALNASALTIAKENLGDLDPASRVLVLVDASGSMFEPVSTRRGDQRAQAFEGLRRDEVAALFASLIKEQSPNADIVSYSTTGTHLDLSNAVGPVDRALAIAASASGGGTDTWRVLLDAYDDHDVVVVLTDEQTSWSPFDPDVDGRRSSHHPRPTKNRSLPTSAKVITCNLAGDVASQAPSHPNHLHVAGISPVVLEGIASAVANRPWGAGV